jgi:hypothetical protein
MKTRGAVSRYNLFRRKADEHVYCAVPEGYPVPPFVDGQHWEFRGSLGEDGARPAGFRDDAAAAAARLSGYYLFQEHRA